MTLTWKKLSTHTLIAALVIVAAFLIGTMSVYAAVDEEEPNDEHQNANKIKMGTYVYGDTSDYNSDWFEFTASINGTAKLIAANDKYSEDGIEFRVYGSAPDNGYMRTAWINSGDTGSITFGVKSGKTYYVQVRAARTIAGKTYYSPWSNRKVVKTK